MFLRTIALPDTFDLNSGSIKFLGRTESIVECLQLLLTTSKGELYGDPGFGCNLRSYLFTSNREVLEDLIKEEIVRSVALYERRISITQDSITLTFNENHVTIQIMFIENKTDELGTFELTLMKEVAA